MIRIQSRHMAPCGCRSSSSPATRGPVDSRSHVCAVNPRNASATSRLSLRVDLASDALRRGGRRLRQPCVGKSGQFHLPCCKASIGGDRESNDGGAGETPEPREPKDEEEFIQASLLVSETMRHYNLRKQGFFEETRWYSSSQILPLSLQAKGSKPGVRSIGHGFLRQFQNPTIFLKVACDGDLLLPIIVGEFAIERLVDTLSDENNEGSLDQFKFVKNLVGTLGYEVKMVRIIKRVVNTYHARIFLGKPSEGATLSIDSRPSDAIHLAIKCQVPIYISKDIVLKDAIKIVYGTWRGSSVKTVYDVLLDSAPDGPDVLAEELDLIGKLNVAVTEERFEDAATCRDKLARLRLKRLNS
ncbi:unnamed protein product [Spirodela intermedia]|uniref:BFN domain-containing protein n=1 Tax=Spirodela intermedia TaxID=51605 RepID=A0A7I8L2P4_SPIIN|nr:unnamed protein product [Spirodela intermedia]